MAVSTQLFEMIDATVEGLGYELVDVEKLPRGLIRGTIDKDGGITLDDCEKVSNQLNNAMTVENVDYDRLEVSSPGVDRPLKRPRDFVKFVGQNVHVELFAPITGEGLPENGRRRLDGTLDAVEGDENNPSITMTLSENRVARTPAEKQRAAKTKAKSDTPAVTVTFPFNDVERANLVPDLNFRGAK